MAGPLEGKVALVTGASRGIGRAAALEYARAGAKVIAVARAREGLESLDDEARAAGAEPVTLVPMDLADVAGADPLGLEIHRRHGHLDLWLHAAAQLGRLRPVAHVPPALWDEIVAVNLTSVFRLIRSLEALLLASPAGRAILMTSAAAAHPRAFWGPYAATKAAIEALARCWADEQESSSLRVLVADPGAVATAMRAEAYPGEDPATLPQPAEVARFLLDLALRPDPGLPERPLRFRDWRPSA